MDQVLGPVASYGISGDAIYRELGEKTPIRRDIRIRRAIYRV